MYEIYIARAAEIFGLPKTREIYKQAIESVLPEKDAKIMALKFAELEKSLGEIDRSRQIYVYASRFSDPRSDIEFWSKWHEFEVQHGNEETFRDMLRIKRTVSASFTQTHFILPEHLLQKNQKANLEEAMDELKKSGGPEDEMAALERQLVTVADNTLAKDGTRKLGFVSAGVESRTNQELKSTTNNEDIELPEESDSEEEERVQIAQKDVPTVVFGGLVRKREDNNEDEAASSGTGAKSKDGDSHLGALERIKRMRQG